MEISVIIPTLNEAKTIEACLEAVGEDRRVEVVVCDGQSTDGTRDLAAVRGARVFTSSPSRGLQLNRGAAEASADRLLFVHADCRLPAGWCDAMLEALADSKTSLACFWLRTEANDGGRAGPLRRFSLRILDLRSRGLRLPYGDQGFAVRREIFEAVGGFPDIPLMEDVVFARSCKALGAIARLPLEMRTGARRFDTFPVSSRLVMLCFPLLFRLGVSPEVLARWYPEAR